MIFLVVLKVNKMEVKEFFSCVIFFFVEKVDGVELLEKFMVYMIEDDVDGLIVFEEIIYIYVLFVEEVI